MKDLRGIVCVLTSLALHTSYAQADALLIWNGYDDNDGPTIVEY